MLMLVTGASRGIGAAITLAAAKLGHQVIAVGSGGNFAFAAARALYDHVEDPEAIARKAMEIAAQICVYTNGNLTVEKLNG